MSIISIKKKKKQKIATEIITVATSHISWLKAIKTAR